MSFKHTYTHSPNSESQQLCNNHTHAAHTHTHTHMHTHSHTLTHTHSHSPHSESQQLCNKHARSPQPAGQPGGRQGGVVQSPRAHHAREDGHLGVQLPRKEEVEVPGFVGEVGPLQGQEEVAVEPHLGAGSWGEGEGEGGGERGEGGRVVSVSVDVYTGQEYTA